MDFRIGADVRLADGEKLGTVRRVVYDPTTEQVVALVADDDSIDDREVIVPLDTVTDADDIAVTVTLSADAFRDLEEFERRRNIAPPPDAANVHSDLIKDPADVPDVAPIGAATGVESIAFTPIIEEDINVPTGDQVIDGHTTVWATDGQVGHVKQIRVDNQTGRLASLIVESGFLFTHETDVPADLIEGMQTETVILRVPRAEVGDTTHE